MSESNIYDLIIVGGGPAGLTAAIYATRRKLKTVLVSMTIGGQMAMTSEIENYPGFDLIDGLSLANKMKSQAEKFGAEFLFQEVLGVERAGEIFKIKTVKGEYEAKLVILAFGLTPRKLAVPGEKEWAGKGVTYCATCDGPLFKNKTVAVVGGGNSALEAGEYLSKIAKHVYLINRSEKFRAQPYILDMIKGIKNIEVYCDSQITEIKGDDKVKSITMTDSITKTKTQDLAVDGVFIEIGYQAKTDWLKGTVDLNDKGEVIIDGDGATSVAGIFSAGDCSNNQYKQIVIAAGAGAKTALQAYKYIIAKDGKAATPDWGKCELIGTKKTATMKTETN